MGKIYSQATRVVVWLGMPDETSSYAIQAILNRGICSDSRQEEKCSKLGAVRRLCSREYWSRLWIIQEVLLARELHLYCGGESFTWDNLSDFISNLWRRRLLDPLPPAEIFAPSHIDAHRGSCVADISGIQASIPSGLCIERADREQNTSGLKGSRTLLEICSKFGEAKCEDPRDKVFGLHSFAATCCRGAVPIDYTMSWPGVVERLLRHMLRHRDVKFEGPNMATYHQLHQKLQINLRDFSMTALDTGPESYIFVTGYLRGHISHVESNLSLCDGANLAQAQLPSVSVPLQQQLEYILSLRNKGQTHQSHISNELDLVASTKNGALPTAWGPTLEDFVRHHQTEKTQESAFLKVFKGQISRTRHKDSVRHFRQVLEDARIVVTRVLPRACKLAMEEGGLIMFAPNRTEVGDLVCQFLSTNILVIVREHIEQKGRYYVIGRAVNLLVCTPELMSEIRGRRGTVRPGWSGYDFPRLAFALDIPTLHMMARTSATPDDMSVAAKKRFREFN